MSTRSPRWPVLLALGWLALATLAGLFAPVIATDQPWTCVCEGVRYYPLFQPRQLVPDGPDGRQLVALVVDWKEKKNCEKKVFAPIPFKGAFSDRHNVKDQPPGARNAFGEMHLLGTTPGGGDLFALLLHGSRVSLAVGLFTAVLIVLLGVLLGGLAGFFGDTSLRLRKGALPGLVPALVLAWYYAHYLRGDAWRALEGQGLGPLPGEIAIRLVIALAVAAVIVAGPAALPGWFRQKAAFPLDLTLQKIMELLESLPRLVLILAIGAAVKSSLPLIMVLIAFTSWTGVARLVRTEMLKIREMDFITAARAAGVGNGRIWLRHALPHALGPAWVSLAFAVGGAMMAESALSYLGLIKGSVSWGSLMGQVRGDTLFLAWWQAVFPGLAIFLTVLACNVLGEQARQKRRVGISPPSLQ